MCPGGTTEIALTKITRVLVRSTTSLPDADPSLWPFDQAVSVNTVTRQQTLLESAL
jgi:hypothetical protein